MLLGCENIQLPYKPILPFLIGMTIADEYGGLLHTFSLCVYSAIDNELLRVGQTKPIDHSYIGNASKVTLCL